MRVGYAQRIYNALRSSISDESPQGKSIELTNGGSSFTAEMVSDINRALRKRKSLEASDVTRDLSIVTRLSEDSLTLTIHFECKPHTIREKLADEEM
jgi:phosphoheptose isomerase